MINVDTTSNHKVSGKAHPDRQVSQGVNIVTCTAHHDEKMSYV